jgi:triacylglycerol lipase
MTDFDPQATGLSLRNARLLGQAAAVSYNDENSCRQWAAANGLDEAFDFFSSSPAFPRTDTNGFVAQNSQMVLVAFRGTNPRLPVDWFTDLNALRETVSDLPGKVHQGFNEALRAVWGPPPAGKEILPQRLLDRGGRAVWITGHSLGGALAELCAAQAFFVNHVPIQGIYTFGQPRVGDETFGKAVQNSLGGEIFRFINDKDIVPRVPWFTTGFRHYGSEIFFNHQRKQENRAPSVEMLLEAIRLASLAVNLDPLVVEARMAGGEHTLFGNIQAVLASGTENISDHNMTNDYLPRLNNASAIAQTV